MWRDRPFPRGEKRRNAWIAYSPRLRFSEKLYREAIGLMAEAGLNMVVLDLGDAVRWKSHPEIALRDALPRRRFRALLEWTRGQGVEPIPKLNFSAGHHRWLGQYRFMLCTPAYDRVVRDLIEEAAELFDGPRLFHLGMDEERFPTNDPEAYSLHNVTRHGRLWRDAVGHLGECTRRAGARPWVWGDPLWEGSDQERRRAFPKGFVVSDWHYHSADDYPPTRRIAEMGYELIPTTSNHSSAESTQTYADWVRKNVPPRQVLGMLQTVWRPLTASYRSRYVEAIDLAGRAFRPGPEKAK